MSKLVIPAILATTILAAGMFVMMPVYKASTVHSGLQASLGGNLVVLTATVNPANAATNTATWTLGVPFCVMGVYRTGGSDANTNLDVGVFTLATDLSPAATTALAIDDAAGAASIAAADILGREAAGVIEMPACGATSVTVETSATAGDAADTNVLSVIAQTRGSVIAPAAVLS
jgi:hypothetical protein